MLAYVRGNQHFKMHPSHCLHRVSIFLLLLGHVLKQQLKSAARTSLVVSHTVSKERRGQPCGLLQDVRDCHQEWWRQRGKGRADSPDLPGFWCYFSPYSKKLQPCCSSWKVSQILFLPKAFPRTSVALVRQEPGWGPTWRWTSHSLCSALTCWASQASCISAASRAGLCVPWHMWKQDSAAPRSHHPILFTQPSSTSRCAGACVSVRKRQTGRRDDSSPAVLCFGTLQLDGSTLMGQQTPAVPELHPCCHTFSVPMQLQNQDAGGP